MNTVSGVWAQSRAASVLEAVAKVAVGYVLAMLTQLAVFPVFGLAADPAQHLGLALVFTLVSLARSYALRCLFETVRLRRDTS